MTIEDETGAPRAEDEFAATPAAKQASLGSRFKGLFSVGDGPPLRDVAATSGWYPLVILTVLNTVDELDRAALGVFAPNIQRYFGINDTVLGAITGAQFAMLIIAGVPIGYWATKVDRARLLRWSAAAWSAFSTATAVAITLPTFVITRLGSGIGKSAVEPASKALLADIYPQTAWNRVFAIHNAANPIGGILGPALAALIGLFVSGDAAWRLAFPILTIPSVIALVAARRLKDKEGMAKQVLGATMSATGAPKGLGFIPATRRLIEIKTFRTQVIGIGVLGFGLVGIITFGSLFYERVFGLDEAGRGIVFAILGFASLFGTLLGGNVGERLFQRSPSQSVRLVGVGISFFSVVICASVFIPWLAVVVFVQFFAIVAVTMAVAPLSAVLSAITPGTLRPLMFSLLGLCIALFGGVLGGAVVGAISDATNIQIGLATLGPSGVVGGLLMSRGSRTVDADIAAANAA